MVLVSDGGASMSLDDCRCPVCLEIFIEPVTLPCTHTFCKGCFLESVDKAALSCPLCRKRVSTWARLHGRSNTLVNTPLWTRIQARFPQQCQRRLSGQDAVADDDPGASAPPPPRVCLPGELRQEYEAQVSKLTEEKRVLEEEERRASEEYIQRLLAEEEEQQEQERRRREEDERLARLLSDQLNSPQEARPGVTPVKKKEVTSGQIDKFLCLHPSPACSSSSNKENFLVTEETQPAECAPPQLDYYGRAEPPDLRPPPSAPDEGHMTSLTKRKSREPPEEVAVTKRVRLPPSSSSSSLEVGEEELLSRQQQEEEDRRLALLLQKELDQEERQRATDRRKGSSDAYLLRQHHQGAAESSSSHSPRRASSSSSSSSSVKAAHTSSSSSSSVKASKTSSSSSSSVKASKTSSSSSSSSVKAAKPSPSSPSSPLSRGSKQTTLTEMFSPLSG